MTIDKILFILANDITDENVLAVLAALQNYQKAAYDKIKGWNSVHSDNRQIALKIYLVYEHERHYFLFDRCLPHLASIKKTIEEVNTKSFDCIVSLSIDAALKIADKTNKPLADALGVLIGGEGGTLPDVSNLCNVFELLFDVVLDSQIDLSAHRAIVHTMNELLGPTGKVAIYASGKDSPLENQVKVVFGSKCVIGYSSFETYLACALRKPVLEIQTNRHLYKWSNPGYICVTEENQEAIRKGIQLCLQKICVESTTMVLETSSVQDVAIT